VPELRHSSAWPRGEVRSQILPDRIPKATSLIRQAKGPGELGLSSRTDAQREAAWRAEFERLGEQLVFDNVKQGAIYNNEAKRQAALRWLAGQTRLHRTRDARRRLAWVTFFVAIAGTLVGAIGLLAVLRD
jgi:hypothetical protein